MKKIKNFISSNKFNFGLMIIWLICTLFSLCFHELWRDEAQAWCIVRDLGVIDIFKEASIEGHPVLWYLLLILPAKMRLGVISMQIISFFSVFLAVLILLFKSPFNKFEKTIIIFSAGFVYYLPVAARNYCLIPFFLFLIALLYTKRDELPCKYAISIILLSHTHLYIEGFCIMLSLFFTSEKIRDYIKDKNIKVFFPVIVLAVNFLILFFIFFNAHNSNYALENDIRMGLSFSNLCIILPKILLYNIAAYFSMPENLYTVLSLLLFYPPVFAFLLALFKYDRKQAFICIGAIAYIFFLFTNIYFNGILYQKSFLLFLLILFAFFIVKESGVKMNKFGIISFYVLFCISFFTVPFVIWEDYKYNFSGGRQIARYIKKNLNNENTFIAAGNPFLYSSIAAYLPGKKFYNIISDSYISYYTYLNIKDDNAGSAVLGENAKYIIAQEDIDFSAVPDLELVYKSDDKNISSKTQREVFAIYRQK